MSDRINTGRSVFQKVFLRVTNKLPQSNTDLSHIALLGDGAEGYRLKSQSGLENLMLII